MLLREREIAAHAFSTPEWLSAADALFQATGVIVSIMDFDECVLISGDQRCGYCNLATEVSGVGPLTCFDSCPAPDSGPGRVTCRAGLTALYAPVVHGDSNVVHVVMTGFVTSTRERRGLYEQLISRGTNEDVARRALKALPVITRRQAEAYLQMSVASAQTLLGAAIERAAASERIEELRLFVSAGQHVVSTERLDAGALSGIAEEAVALIGGEAGAILRPRGRALEVVARTEGWRGPLGAIVPRESTASGRAVEASRTVVAPGKAGVATLSMPLMQGERVLGVLEVRISQSLLPLTQDRLSRLNRFGQFIAIAVEREDERAAVERAMTGYAQLNELATALGGQTDINGVAHLLTSVLEKAFGFGVAGLVLSSWGEDRADVVVCGEVPRPALDTLLGDVCGRDMAADPIESVRVVSHRGELVDAEDFEDWALLVSELRHGNLQVGQMFVARADGERFGAQDHALLEGIAAHGGAAFGRAALFTRIRDDYAKTIAALSATLDIGEHAMTGHATRVMDYAMLIGQELRLGYEATEQLRFAGLLHDIGKTGIPSEILLKPSKLTPDELDRVRRHSEVGAEIVEQIDFLKGLTPIILHHHERWDGGGYPHGLKGEAIPLLARVLCVADAFDAMTSERTYAPKLTVAQAKAELEAGVGTQFDPRVVAGLLEVIDRQALAGGTGLFVGESLGSRADLPA